MRIGVYDQRTGTAEAGGTETMIRELAQELQDDHQIVLYTGRGELLDEVAAMDIDVVQVPWLSKFHPLTKLISSATPMKSAEIGSLSMYLAGRATGIFDRIEEEVDVLWLHYYLDNLLISRTVGVPTVYHVAGIKQRSVRWKTMFKNSCSDLYVANSESTRDRIERWYDVDVDEVIYPGVNGDRFLAETNETGNDGVTILYVGRLDDGKGLLDLLEAVAELDVDDVMLRIVGDGHLKEELQARAYRLGVDPQVELVGAVPHERIHTEYARANVFCLPSYHESHAIVNIEAMLSAVPVVSTDIDAIREYIHDGETGYLVEPGDVEALTDVLRTLVENPDQRREVGRAGRKVAEDYTVEASATRIESVFERLVETGTTNQPVPEDQQ